VRMLGELNRDSPEAIVFGGQYPRRIVLAVGTTLRLQPVGTVVTEKRRGHSAAAARWAAVPVIHHRRGRSTMATKALLVRLEATSGKEGAVEEFLPSALPLVEQEPGTRPWVRGSVRHVDVRHYRRVPGRGGTRDASWRARRKGPRGESRRALRRATRHQQSRRHSQQALTPLRLSTRF
jgi:hypothetical protein